MFFEFQPYIIYLKFNINKISKTYEIANVVKFDKKLIKIVK